MIGLDKLLDIATYLDKTATGKPETLPTLRHFLHEVYISNEYQAWLSESQFLGPGNLEAKPREPREAARKFPELKHLLTEYGFVTNGRINVKVDSHFGRVHITDGFWVEPTRRVFPTCDESEIVCRHIRENLNLRGDGFLIDPACGSGHHALGLKDIFPRRVSLDISGRAIGFCRFNSILLDDVRHAVGFGDVRAGIPLEYTPPANAHVVFAVNMPFAIDPKESPSERLFTLAQDGGDRGIELTLAALRAIADFSTRNPNIGSIDAVVLAYSLGSQKRRAGGWSWEVEKLAEQLLPDAEIKFTLLEGEKLWRVNGKKEQDNPMPLAKLSLKADCRFTYGDLEREQKKVLFSKLASSYNAAGFTHMGYGLVTARIR